MARNGPTEQLPLGLSIYGRRDQAMHLGEWRFQVEEATKAKGLFTQ